MRTTYKQKRSESVQPFHVLILNEPHATEARYMIGSPRFSSRDGSVARSRSCQLRACPKPPGNEKLKPSIRCSIHCFSTHQHTTTYHHSSIPYSDQNRHCPLFCCHLHSVHVLDDHRISPPRRIPFTSPTTRHNERNGDNTSHLNGQHQARRPQAED